MSARRGVRWPAASKKGSYKRPKRTRSKGRGLVEVLPELKGVDTVIDVAGVAPQFDDTLSSFCLNLVQAGTAAWNRVGRTIRLRSVRVTGLLIYYYKVLDQLDPIGKYTFSGTVRMVVVWDAQPSGVMPRFQDIFGHTQQDGTTSETMFDHVRYDMMERFSVLRDTVKSSPPNVSLSDYMQFGRSEVPFDEYIELGDREVVFSGTSNPATIADVSSGAVYVFFRSSHYYFPGSYWDVERSVARLRYTD